MWVDNRTEIAKCHYLRRFALRVFVSNIGLPVACSMSMSSPAISVNPWCRPTAMVRAWDSRSRGRRFDCAGCPTVVHDVSTLDSCSRIHDVLLSPSRII